MVKNIRIEKFDYPLPDDRIAKFPLKNRDMCKLIQCSSGGDISHHIFNELPDLLPANSLLIANETKVINARLEFFKSTGARIEIFILEPHSPADYALAFASKGRCVWSCLVGNRKKWKSGPIVKMIDIDGVDRPVELTANLIGEADGNASLVAFSWDNPEVSFASIVESAGNIPIPPYLNRESTKSDVEDYQTVFSKTEGSVAAPTAGLHFTPSLLKEIEAKGIPFLKLTLHVGAGTFRPVKSDTIGEHPMHTETFAVSRELISALISSLQEQRPIVAVGTTTVRTLESLPYLGMILQNEESPRHVPQWLAYDSECSELDTLEMLRNIQNYMDSHDVDSLTASTAIMIAPQFKWRIVSEMVTNFHQPQSTLLLLVSSFLGEGENLDSDHIPVWRKLYNEALDNDYRFLSYGDACFLHGGFNAR